MIKQTSPQQRYPDGSRVYAILAGENGTVIAARLIGKRHPGYVYEIRLDSGQTIHQAQGLLR